MAKVKIILDKRRANVNNQYPIKIYIYHRGQIYISTQMTARAEAWNELRGEYIGTSIEVKAKNARLRDMLGKAETLLLTLSVNNELQRMTAKTLRNRLERELNIVHRGALLVDYLEKAKAGKAERTVRLFAWAQKRVEEHDAKVRVNDIDEGWVIKYRDFLAEKYAPNTVAQGMAWVSRALSLAVADGVISRNPAALVRKPHAETRKKSLTVETLRQLRDMEFSGPYAAKFEYARDVFMLQFYLLGINIVDLFNITEVRDGRIEYIRSKTGTLYSVKVYPEAAALINKLRGEHSLVSLSSRYAKASVACTAMTYYLQQIYPKLSTNYARHTWATIAAEIGLPIETVSHALGHKIGSPITAIYVAYSQKKVDDANRRVIDYINKDLAK